MAAIDHGIVQDLTVQSEVATIWSTFLTCPLANFVAGGKYLIIVTAQVAGAATTNPYNWRVLHGAVEFEGSQKSVEPKTAWPVVQAYGFMTVFDQPGGGAEDIHFQMKTGMAASAAVVDTIQIFYMRLDDDLVDGTDYKYAEDDDSGAPTLHTGAFQDFASITFTPGVGAEDWLIIACPNWEMNSLSRQPVYRINRDVGADVAPETTYAAESTNDQGQVLLMRTYTLTAAAHTFKVQGKDDDVTNHNAHYHSAIFALRLNAFVDHGFFWNEAEHALIGAGAWHEIGNVDIVVTVAEDFLLLGGYAADMDMQTRTAYLRLQVDGVTDPAGSDGYESNPAGGNNQEEGIFQMAMPACGVGAVDFDMDGKRLQADVAAEDRSFTAFSMELAGGAPPGALIGHAGMASIGC